MLRLALEYKQNGAVSRVKMDGIEPVPSLEGGSAMFRGADECLGD